MTTLITGSTGKTSSRLAALFHKNNRPFVVGTRRQTKTVSILSSSKESITVPAVQFDWYDESTHENLFTVVTEQQQPLIKAVYLVSPAAAEGGKDAVAVMKKFIDLAIRKGVVRFVLLSASIVEKGGPVMGQVHSYLEQLQGEEAGKKLEWAVVRPTWFMNNFSEALIQRTVQKESRFYSATGEGRVPLVHTEDIAGVAYACLTVPKPPNRDYLVLGPELLSYDDAARMLSEALGRKVRHVKLDVEGMARKYEEYEHMSPEYAKVLAGLESLIAVGKEDRLDGLVQELTGTRGKVFADFVRENLHVWKA